MEKALICHTAVDPKTATPDDLDVFEQVRFVSENLAGLGYDPIAIPFYTGTIRKEIKKINPLFVFNLVESVFEQESFTYIAPFFFEQAEIPYTGCTRQAFEKTSTKLLTKKILSECGIDTPYFLTKENLSESSVQGRRFLIKSSETHASIGLETKLHETKDSIESALKSKGMDYFAEEYIEGREFNISILGPVKKPLVLPLAEMQFRDWKEGKLKIVDYEAKWNPNTHEYHATVHNFEFPEKDQQLIQNLRSICERCWNIFDLRGYARVDFRVSEQGKPYVLEVNANPCISPDAGFIAAAKRAGIDSKELVKRIVEYSCEI